MLILHTAFLRPLAEPFFGESGESPREGAARWLRALGEAGAGALLLDAEIPPSLWEAIEGSLRPPSGSFLVLAMRPPASPGAPRARGLASPDKEERAAAVKAHARRLPLADRLGCRLWLLRLGAAEMESPMEELRALWERERLPGSEEGLERAREILAIRARRAAPLGDAARWSLERLLREAERLEMTLCLENRWDVRGYPTYREAEALLREFAGAPLGFWHNAGHAAVHAQLGLAEEGATLERMKPWLKGGTLHDARGTLDHLPPGEGEADFGALLSQIPPGLPWAADVRRRRRAGRPGQEAAERAEWERERAGRGRGGLPARAEAAGEETLPADPSLVKEALEAFGEMGF